MKNKESNFCQKKMTYWEKFKHINFFQSLFYFREKKKYPIIFTNYKKNSKMGFLIKDLNRIAPHSKIKKIMGGENIFDFLKFIRKKKQMFSFFFFEKKKKKHIDYLWISKFPDEPLIQMEIYDVKSLQKLHFLGNCCCWSTPLISFDKFFKKKPHLNIIKKIVISFFSSKKNDNRTEPFIDHVISLCYLNNKIWFRVYQIRFSKKKNQKNFTIDQFIEIGPRLVLNIRKIWAELEKKNCLYNSLVFKKNNT
jgi:hypothetical protein